MLNQENAKRYLKDFMPKEQILKPRIAEMKSQSGKQSKYLPIEVDNGYNIKDIIKECPNIKVIRDFIEFQCKQIKDDDDNLFL